jgi:hypothetical protein
MFQNKVLRMKLERNYGYYTGLREKLARMGGGWNWLRIVSNGFELALVNILLPESYSL